MNIRHIFLCWCKFQKCLMTSLISSTTLRLSLLPDVQQLSIHHNLLIIIVIVLFSLCSKLGTPGIDPGRLKITHPDFFRYVFTHYLEAKGSRPTTGTTYFVKFTQWYCLKKYNLVPLHLSLVLLIGLLLFQSLIQEIHINHTESPNRQTASSIFAHFLAHLNCVQRETMARILERGITIVEE